MKKVILAVVILVSSFVQAQAPGQFEKGMGNAFKLWGEGKNTEASAMFERIASAEKNSWLPNYYVALVNTTTAFGTKDKETVNALLTKAQDALDIEMIKDQSNAELYVMQGLIYTAWIVYDPMTNGMKLSGKVMEAYTKAEMLAPNNPRVVFSKADFQIQGASWTGVDTKPLCAEVQRAIGLFATFKPETPFSPKWGLDRAEETLKGCKK
jgi:hypothetical protein